MSSSFNYSTMTNNYPKSSIVQCTLEIDVNEINNLDELDQKVEQRQKELGRTIMIEAIKKNKRFLWQKPWWQILIWYEMVKKRFKLKLSQ